VILGAADINPQGRRRRARRLRACCAKCAGGGGLGDLGDPLIWWPGAVRQLLDEVNGQIAAIDRDVLASKIGPQTVTSWRAFAAEWAKYYGSASVWTGATVERAREFQARAADWRKRLEGGGLESSTPPIRVGAAPGFPWKWVIGGAVAIGGVYLGGKYIAGRVAR
jgi:hypothetical protein